ncbi:phosphotransferase [Sorangium sp. So ce302]|uniref:phosphotransferase n=1 Tax=Sorangium sp. So ce302 TaxID=3133297 RepID=UPI003F625463
MTAITISHDAPGGHSADEDGNGPNITVQCSFEAMEDMRLTAIRHSAEKLMVQVFNHKMELTAPEIIRPVWHVQEAVWPVLKLPEFANTQPSKVKLTLLPLNRIGQMEGRSGSLVLIGYFSEENLGRLYSHPIVIKTLARSGSKSSKLREEHDNATSIKPFAYDNKDNFAIPLFLDERQDGYDVLWSICSATSSIKNDGEVPRFDVKDLRGPLTRNDSDRVIQSINSVYDLLKNCHRRFGMASRIEVKLGDEYAWYLRGMWDNAVGRWGQRWQDVWGAADQKFIRGSTGSAINPLWVTEKLASMRCPMRMGAIHGDLHPGNVILRDHGLPTIIDFGWAQDRAHVAKDFVLLECNLRFLTLRTELRTDEVEPFARWVGWNSDPPEQLCDYLNTRINMIRRLREKAAEVFPGDTNWNQEYVAPLFLVAMGLLRFAPQLGNQQAAVRFVELTANFLTDAFGWQ